MVRQHWADHGIRPSQQAEPGKWCRRVYLDVIGRTPTIEELGSYLDARPSDRKQQLVEKLLGPKYAEEYAEHWAGQWTNTLVGRTGGENRRSLTDRDALQGFLRDSLLGEKPYDELVTELLTASGANRSGMDGYNPAVNYLIEKMQEKAVQATAKTAEVFLGTSVQCTQCHNHPFNEYKQNQFWELNAFFRQVRVRRDRDGDERNRATLTDADFAGEGRSLSVDPRRDIVLTDASGTLADSRAQMMRAAPVFYELRNGRVEMAFPVFIDGTSLAEVFSDRGKDFGKSGYLEDVNRREELASLIVSSTEFEQAIANRMWAAFLGRGLVNPVHDMGPHNGPSHPELLAYLGGEVRSAGFDLKSLIRWVVLSEAYGLSSKAGRANETDDAATGGPGRYSRFYLRQMSPEQLYRSLIAATDAANTLDEERRGDALSRWLRQFSEAFGTDDGAESTTFNGAVPQVLMMMNGELTRRACDTGSGSFLDRVANDPGLSNRDKISRLYLAALARQPTKHELKVCNRLLAVRGGDVVETLQDVWWALLNSNEFILVH